MFSLWDIFFSRKDVDGDSTIYLELTLLNYSRIIRILATDKMGTMLTKVNNEISNFLAKKNVIEK